MHHRRPWITKSLGWAALFILVAPGGALAQKEREALTVISPVEAAVLRELESNVPAKPVLVICDIGRDQDDEVALAALAQLQEMGSIDLKAVITTLGPSDRRARLAKGALTELGLPQVPVAAGSAANQDPENVHAYEFDAPYMASADSVGSDAQAMIKKTFLEAGDKSLTVLVVAAMTDLAQFIEENRDLVARKAERFVFMGDVIRDKGAVSLWDGRMRPDSANNNTFDMDASEAVYQAIQDLGIPSTVVTREAAYASSMSKEFFVSLAHTGHPVGQRLCASQQRSIEGLWNRVLLPTDDPARGGLPPRCDRFWFESTFCSGPLAGAEQVWDNVTRLPVYDGVAALAVLGEDQRSKMFTPFVLKIEGTKHEIIGISASNPGTGRIGPNLALSALTKSVMLVH